MKTIITQKIDGYNIIVALSEAAGFIDPVETSKVVADKIKETETSKRIESIHKQMADLAKQGTKYKLEVKELLKLGKKNESAQAHQKFLDTWKKMKAFEPELKDLFVAMKSEYRDLMMKHAVYAGMKPNETLIEDSKAEEFQTLLSEALPNGQLVTSSGDKVADNRGRKYWKKNGAKWEQSEIYALGKEPKKDEISELKLTDEQRAEIENQLETERISAMNKADKKAERDAREAGLRAQARDMSRDLEIANDKDAIKKSQDWLSMELAKLDEVYG